LFLFVHFFQTREYDYNDFVMQSLERQLADADRKMKTLADEKELMSLEMQSRYSFFFLFLLKFDVCIVVFELV
jgi:hypothetical protein